MLRRFYPIEKHSSTLRCFEERKLKILKNMLNKTSNCKLAYNKYNN